VRRDVGADRELENEEATDYQWTATHVPIAIGL
jgi:hypothetical protein